MKLFLLGFMGSGKSHWGRIWSRIAGMPFYDLDDMIEKTEQLSIADIFEKKGDSRFREMEYAALRSFEGQHSGVIACGGGTPCFGENLSWMNANGITVYLEATPNQIHQRVLEEMPKRPLLKNVNPAELLLFIEQKLKEREPFYRQAKFTLHVTELNNNSILEIMSSPIHKKQ